MTKTPSPESGGLAELHKQAVESKGAICRMTYNCRLPSHDIPLWGQFFPVIDGGIIDASDQFGIYGTASAATILALSDDQHHRASLAAIRGALPGWAGTLDASPLDPNELHLTLKSTAVLEALPPISPGDIWAVFETLLAGRVTDVGWGYVSAKHDAAAKPAALPTAHAILALTAHPEIAAEHTSILAQATAWLCSRVLDTASLSRLESVFAALALRQVRPLLSSDLSESAISPAIDKLAQRILLMADRPPILVEYYEHVHYQAPSIAKLAKTTPGQSHKSRYMFYPADIIAARALLEVGAPKDGRLFVLRVVERVSWLVLERGAYFSAATGRAAIADACAAVRLLDTFIRVHTNNPDLLEAEVRSPQRAGDSAMQKEAMVRARELESKVDSLTAQQIALDKRIHERAVRDAGRRILWMSLLLASGLGTASAAWSLLSQTTGWLWVAVGAGLLAILSGIRQFVPGTVMDWLAPARRRLARALERRRRERLGLSPTLDAPRLDTDE